jgi:TPR repeat protein
MFLAVAALLLIAAAPADKGLKLYNKGKHAEALEVWKKGAAQGDLASINNVGFFAEARGDEAVALTWYRSAAEAGLPVAMRNLGRILIKAEASRTEGFAWLTVAARFADTAAITLLAANGKDVPSPDLAIREQERQAALLAQQQANNDALAAALVGGIIGAMTPRQSATPDPVSTYGKTNERRCDYFTPQGKRTLVVTGACPFTYGE